MLNDEPKLKKTNLSNTSDKVALVRVFPLCLEQLFWRTTKNFYTT